ncbi:putative methyltransferase-domain-containing protein [Crepidotus variabilis]|uniref:Methyltransferase-domain-containing protein n=1 Tax=Crepidotus variabilis TaxID=179855 RepID=A0A9P6JMS5_9AGAR|nr:putative methyltransferase-domain-containing protein [Crepidotus variabilis]
MFYYITFLRPPPTHANLHQSILITPQISNDLRTETFPDSQDLFYSWVQVLRVQNAESPLRLTTKPQKLTTWRNSSAYKAIPVQPPREVKEGQFWRLVLMSEGKSATKTQPEAIDLRQIAGNLEETERCKKPLSVWSMLVLFTAKAGGSGKGGGAGKQEHVERLYLLPGHESSSETTDTSLVELRLVEQTSFDLDKKIWDSGIGLSSWLCDLRQSQTSIRNPTMLELSKRLFGPLSRIVELGAGIGVVSISLAILRSGYTHAAPEHVDDNSRTAAEGSTMFATDVPSALPLLEENVKLNRQYYASETGSPIPLVLDWEDEELPDEIKTQGGVDVIIMADVCYNTTFFGALTQTLSKLVELSTSAEHSKSPLVLLGYKERDESERTFWDLALNVAGIKFEKVGEIKGAAGCPVEIWLGNVI